MRQYMFYRIDPRRHIKQKRRHIDNDKIEARRRLRLQPADVEGRQQLRRDGLAEAEAREAVSAESALGRGLFTARRRLQNVADDRRVANRRKFWRKDLGEDGGSGVRVPALPSKSTHQGQVGGRQGQLKNNSINVNGSWRLIGR